MRILTIGLNHKTASVGLRERLAFSKGKLDYAYECISNFPSIKGALILSTCNRVELYCAVDNLEQGASSAKKFLSSYHSIETGNFEDNLYVYSDAEAVSHLFNVACGLDSLVVGETQVLRQLKEAYLYAHENNAADKFLNVLLQKSFNTAKKVRSLTDIGRGRVSVSSIGIKMAEEILGDLSKKVILVIGAGKTSRLAIKYLASKEANSIILTNRNFFRADELCRSFPGRIKAIRFDNLLEYIINADVVISSTSAPHFVIKYDDVDRIAKKRENRPLFFIDLAVPRDIEPRVSSIKDVHIYDIDDLKKIAKKNIRLRREEISICESIIKEQVTKFMDWFEWQKMTEQSGLDFSPKEIFL